MSVSDFRQLLIFSAAAFEYGTEGCDCEGGGSEGLRGVCSEGAEVAAQPITLRASMTSINNNAGLTRGGDFCSIVHITLTALLHLASLDVRLSGGKGPLGLNIGAPLSVDGEVRERERGHDGGENPQTG